jgi:hypothetical protein
MTYDETLAHLRGLVGRHIATMLDGAERGEDAGLSVRVAGVLEEVSVGRIEGEDMALLHMHGGDVRFVLGRDEFSGAELHRRDDGESLLLMFGGATLFVTYDLP